MNQRKLDCIERAQNILDGWKSTFDDLSKCRWVLMGSSSLVYMTHVSREFASSS
jgi:hypothetical protein